MSCVPILQDYSPYDGGEAAPELCYPGGASRNVERVSTLRPCATAVSFPHLADTSVSTSA